MPAYQDQQGRPVVEFRGDLEVSPFSVFRALRDGTELLLVDVRENPQALTLSGSMRMPDPAWAPESESPRVILFDDDGSAALTEVSRLHRAGYETVRALFGGLELYAFALDPQVVGEQTYLIQIEDLSTNPPADA